MARTRIPLDREWVAEQKKTELLASAVAELDLDVRTVNGLEEVGVLYVRELVELTRGELARIPNFGTRSVERIIQVLGEHGLAIRSDSISPARKKH
ncbi:DNA-directed RNA polymerase subunit alpha C-terminal domain-containing protein [Rhodopirellula sp. JC639]|uniref:DNA-directed RNA polymerase subunit alpha C-terminal domain-containing protein n=1 Tax=Stieleria mannarensis TaxID=2755585 RepID=UPI00336ACD07